MIQGKDLQTVKDVLQSQRYAIVYCYSQTLELILARREVAEKRENTELFLELESILADSIKAIPPLPSMNDYIWDPCGVLEEILEKKILKKIEEKKWEGVEKKIALKASVLLAGECFERCYFQKLPLKEIVCVCRSL